MAVVQITEMLWTAAILLVVVQGIYVPEETATVLPVKPAEPVCPEQCACSQQNTSSCIFKFEDYSLDVLTPWHLTRLRIMGSIEEGILHINPKQDYDYVFPSLRSVICKHQQLLDVTAIESTLSQLVELHVNFVPIRHLLQSDFQYMENLTVLNLSRNGIQSVDRDSFKMLENLKMISLEDNAISSLPLGVFSGLNGLTRLNLNGNQLKVLPTGVFSEMVLLEDLNLGNNMITRIDNVLDSLPNLTRFDLQSNKITYILPASVEKLSSFRSVQLSGNPFDCSCMTGALKSAMQDYPSIYQSVIVCDSPPPVKGRYLNDIYEGDMECNMPEISSISAPPYGLYQRDITLDCSVKGSSPLGVYWITPWGDKFALPATQYLFPNVTAGALVEQDYSGINLILTSHVHISENGSLSIRKLRGHLSGDFTCVAVSLLGIGANKTVTVHTYTKIRSMYLTSIIIGAICASSALVMAIFIGAVRWFVSRCMHSEGCNCCCCSSDEYDVTDKYKIEETQTVEITYAASDSSCQDFDDADFDPDSSPPTVPVNSPMLRKSPEKCHTPIVEMTDCDKNSMHIWDQLEEVKERLRCGAERKIEKVRSHVRSITDSGSLKIRNIKDASTLKIQSIKETGSHAASKVKKNVASGMEQVKYGVQSIKEFCGTGDMGTGTVSMVSFCTDVDTKEQTKIVKSHTFV